MQQGNSNKQANQKNPSTHLPLGIPWQSRGWNTTISPPRLQLQPLAGELRPCKLWSTAQNKQIPLVTEFWALHDNSEVHLKFLNSIPTAETSLTCKVTARGSGRRLWTCLWATIQTTPSVYREHFLPFTPLALGPCVLESRFSLQGRQPQMLALLQTSGTGGPSEGPHLSGCENVGKSLPLLGGRRRGKAPAV